MARERELHHSPGLEAALHVVRLGAGERVLDLGGAEAANFEFITSFARHLRVADLLGDHAAEGDADTASWSPVEPGWGPFDLVLAWDLLTYLEPEEAARTVASLHAACRPGACLFALATTTEAAAARTLTFLVRDPGTLEYRPAPQRTRRLAKATPAAIQRLLTPFRVERSYVLRNGFQEFVAVLD